VQRALEDRHHRGQRQRLEDVHLRSRQQRRVHFERRVLGRRADQDDVARLDARQEGVLLRLVEAMDLVDEEDRPAPERRRACSASAITSRISLMPDSTALKAMKCARVALAITRASVVLPVPGGPQR
jgi:hypothetical protein